MVADAKRFQWAKALWPRSSSSLPEMATTLLTTVFAAGAGCLAMGAFVLSALVFIGAWILFFSCELREVEVFPGRAQLKSQPQTLEERQAGCALVVARALTSLINYP